MSSSFVGGHIHLRHLKALVWSTKLSDMGKILSVVAEIFNFVYFKVVFYWRLSSFEAFDNFGMVT